MLGVSLCSSGLPLGTGLGCGEQLCCCNSHHSLRFFIPLCIFLLFCILSAPGKVLAVGAAAVLDCHPAPRNAAGQQPKRLWAYFFFFPSWVKPQGFTCSQQCLVTPLVLLAALEDALPSTCCCCHRGSSHQNALAPAGRALLSCSTSLPQPQELHFHPSPPFLPGRDSADSEQRKREEDFYYTEVQVKEEPAPETVAAASPTSVSSSSPIIIQQALAKPEALLLEPPALEPALASSALSQSAPSSFWHIQADHAYQVSSSHPPAPFAALGGFKGAQGLLLRLFQSQGSCRPPLLPCNYPAVVCNTPCSRQIEPGRNAAVPDPARPCCSGNLEIRGGGLVAGPCPMSPATAALGAAGAERGGTDPEASCVSMPTWALN